MTLERQGLQRRTELRRTPFERRKAANRARAPRQRAAKARRDTGPTSETRAVVLDRSLGCCEICGDRVVDVFAIADGGSRGLAPHSVHHRVARAMGGSRVEWINSPANLLLLCGTGTTGCHGYVEANRTEAYESGWLISGRRDPATVPVLLEGGDRYLLTDTGDRIEVAA